MNGIKRTAQYCRQWGKKALELRRCWIVRLLANQLFRGRVILGYRNFTGGIKLFWKSKNRVETWSHMVTFILKCHCQVANFVTAGGVDKKLQYRPKGALLSNWILHCLIKFNLKLVKSERRLSLDMYVIISVLLPVWGKSDKEGKVGGPFLSLASHSVCRRERLSIMEVEKGTHILHLPKSKMDEKSRTKWFTEISVSSLQPKYYQCSQIWL